MKWFRNLKISLKLISAFLVIALIAGGVGVYGVVSLSNMNDASGQVFEYYGNSQGYIGYVASEFQKQSSYLRDIVLEKTPSLTTQYGELIKNSDTLMKGNLAKYKETCIDPDDQQMYAELETAINNFVEVRDAILGPALEGDYAEAYRVMRIDTSIQAVSDAEAAVDKALAANVETASGKISQQTENVDKAMFIMIILMAAAVTLSVLLGVIIARTISRPIRQLSEVADQLAAGDTETKQITLDQKDEVGRLAASFRGILNAVKSLVADVNMLTEAAVRGQLSTRANAEKHQGDYRKIVEGINNTLDAVIEPINEATDVLKEMSRGNLSINVTGSYQGDHAVIKDELNDTINTIKGYIDEITFVLSEVAKGDLEVEITSEYRGDFIELKNSINQIVNSLNNILIEINTAAEQVAAGSRQVSDGNQEISQGATVQASSIEELSASLTQIAAQIKQSAGNTSTATDIAGKAKNAADEGNGKMKNMLESMQEINDSSSNISKIIKVIDDIAFQTNILALNAAVEAARAGAHGKGFAVVAEEVRNLAARSANAANETTALIEGSIRKVETGTQIANETASALSSIVTGSEKSLELLGNISVATGEQAAAITQINRGIEQLSQVVQTNSATAEEGAAASEELSSQAELLKSMIGNFKLRAAAKLNDSPAAAVKTVKTAVSETDRAVPTIVLNDSDFGKY